LATDGLVVDPNFQVNRVATKIQREPFILQPTLYQEAKNARSSLLEDLKADKFQIFNEQPRIDGKVNRLDLSVSTPTFKPKCNNTTDVKNVNTNNEVSHTKADVHSMATPINDNADKINNISPITKTRPVNASPSSPTSPTTTTVGTSTNDHHEEKINKIEVKNEHITKPAIEVVSDKPAQSNQASKQEPQPRNFEFTNDHIEATIQLITSDQEITTSSEFHNLDEELIEDELDYCDPYDLQEFPNLPNTLTTEPSSDTGTTSLSINTICIGAETPQEQIIQFQNPAPQETQSTPRNCHKSKTNNNIQCTRKSRLQRTVQEPKEIRLQRTVQEPKEIRLQRTVKKTSKNMTPPTKTSTNLRVSLLKNSIKSRRTNNQNAELRLQAPINRFNSMPTPTNQHENLRLPAKPSMLARFRKNLGQKTITWAILLFFVINHIPSVAVDLKTKISDKMTTWIYGSCKKDQTFKLEDEFPKFQDPKLPSLQQLCDNYLSQNSEQEKQLDEQSPGNEINQSTPINKTQQPRQSTPLHQAPIKNREQQVKLAFTINMLQQQRSKEVPAPKLRIATDTYENYTDPKLPVLQDIINGTPAIKQFTNLNKLFRKSTSATPIFLDAYKDNTAFERAKCWVRTQVKGADNTLHTLEAQVDLGAETSVADFETFKQLEALGAISSISTNTVPLINASGVTMKQPAPPIFVTLLFNGVSINQRFVISETRHLLLGLDFFNRYNCSLINFSGTYKLFVGNVDQPWTIIPTYNHCSRSAIPALSLDDNNNLHQLQPGINLVSIAAPPDLDQENIMELRAIEELSKTAYYIPPQIIQFKKGIAEAIVHNLSPTELPLPYDAAIGNLVPLNDGDNIVSSSHIRTVAKPEMTSTTKLIDLVIPDTDNTNKNSSKSPTTSENFSDDQASDIILEPPTEYSDQNLQVPTSTNTVHAQRKIPTSIAPQVPTSTKTVHAQHQIPTSIVPQVPTSTKIIHAQHKIPTSIVPQVPTSTAQFQTFNELAMQQGQLETSNIDLNAITIHSLLR
jgi:hypothetical protein